MAVHQEIHLLPHRTVAENIYLGREPKRWGLIDWSKMFGSGVNSWQVEREDFDNLLLEHAAEQGVDVRQGAEIREVHFVDGKPRSAEWTDASGVRQVTEFDALVDASGRAGVLSARHFKNRRFHEIFRNVAIWGYWKGGVTLPNTPSGGIDIISEMRVTPGWGVRPEAVRLISMQYS